MPGRWRVVLVFSLRLPSVPSLPVAAIILRVGQHVANIDLVPVIGDGGDEPVFIAADMKDGEYANVISTRKGGAQVVEVGEDFFLHGGIPRAERILGVWVFRPELRQG